MDDFRDLSLQELNVEIELVEKKIEDEKELLKEAKSAHFQDGEVWLTYNIQFRRIDKIVDEKTNKPLFNKKQIERIRNGLEKISELRKRKNELLLEKVNIELGNDLYEGTVDFDSNGSHYLSYNFRIEDIKRKGEKLSDEQKYKYYVRLNIELTRIMNSFHNTEFKRFDGNMYFGLIEFLDSVEHILEKEKCPELEIIVRNSIRNLDIYAKEMDFKRALTKIDIDLTLLPERLAKTNELLGYEIDYLSKIYQNNIAPRIEEKFNNNTNVTTTIKNDAVDDEAKKIQRDKIRQYLIEHNPDIKGNIHLNISRLAYEITDYIYPGISKVNRRRKKESIRQELMLFKNGKLEL